MKPLRVLLWCIVASLYLLSGSAGAQVITEFSAGITADTGTDDITAGPDGNLWFTEQFGNRIGRITPLGIVTEFSAGISAGSQPSGITAGPDGNLWFTEFLGNRIGRITPAGVITEFSAGISPGAYPYGIAAGPDGNLWFTEQIGNRIGRITPQGVVTEFSTGFSGGAELREITAGPDGNLWFTDYYYNRIGRITPLGVVTELSQAGGPWGITAGPDGNLWFALRDADLIGRITPLGVVTTFSAGPSAGRAPRGIAAGPDGNLWFTEIFGRIVRITPLGAVTEFSAGISPGALPLGITAGPDGNLWFTEDSANRIGRITTGAVVAPIARLLVPDGTALSQTFTSYPDTRWFALGVEPGKTYVVAAADVAGDLTANAIGTLGVFASDGVSTPPEASVDCTAANGPRPPAVDVASDGIRCVVRTFPPSGTLFDKRPMYVKVTRMDPATGGGAQFRIRAREATHYGRWLTAGNYDFHVEVENTTADAMCVEVARYPASGLSYTAGPGWSGSIGSFTLTVPALGAVKQPIPHGSVVGADNEGTLRIGACGSPVNLIPGALHVSTYAFDPVSNTYIYYFTSTANDGKTRSSW